MSYQGYTALRVVQDGGVATVTIDHPPINLFDLTLYPEMARLADALADDPEVRVVVLRSAIPQFFIAHFDVGLILQIPTDLPEPTDASLVDPAPRLPRPELASDPAHQVHKAALASALFDRPAETVRVDPAARTIALVKRG